MRDSGQARLGAFDGDTAAHSGDNIECVVLRGREVFARGTVRKCRSDLCVQSERYPKFRRHQRTNAAKTFRRDSDDGIRLPIHAHAAPDKVRAASHALPKSVTRDHHWNICVRPAFLLCIETAEGGFDPMSKKKFSEVQKTKLRRMF